MLRRAAAVMAVPEGSAQEFAPFGDVFYRFSFPGFPMVTRGYYCLAPLGPGRVRGAVLPSSVALALQDPFGARKSAGSLPHFNVELHWDRLTLKRSGGIGRSVRAGAPPSYPSPANRSLSAG